MMKNRRVDYLDMVKGIGIILVVMGHSEYLAKNALAVIYSFHMPLFFIVSGMINCHIREYERPIGQLIKKKFCTLMIPYAVFSLIYLVIYGGIFCGGKGYLGVEAIKEYAMQAISLDGMSVLWFLSTLFFAQVLFAGIRKMCGRRVTYLILTVLVIAVFLVKTQVLEMLPVQTLWEKGIAGFVRVLLRAIIGAGFLAIGDITMTLLNRFDGYMQARFGEKKVAGQMAAELVFGVTGLVLVTVLGLHSGGIDMHTLRFGNPTYACICAYIGTMALVFICRNLKQQRWLAYLGANSLIIMVTHLDCQFMLLSIRVGQFFAALSPIAKWFCLYFGIVLGMTILELVAIYIVNHFIPFVIGKPYQRRVHK